MTLRAVVIAAALVVAFLGGVAFGHLGQTRGLEKSQELLRRPCDLEAIRRDVASLRDLLAASSSAPAPVNAVREPAPPETQADPNITLRVILDRLERMELQLVNRNTFSSPAPVKPLSDRSAIRRVTSDLFSDRLRVTSEHFCWSPQDVYAAYGQPDYVNDDPMTLRWTYTPDAVDDGVVFLFRHGLVHQVSTWVNPSRTAGK